MARTELLGPRAYPGRLDRQRLDQPSVGAIFKSPRLHRTQLSVGVNCHKLWHERTATDTRQSGLTEKFDNRGHHVERAGKTVVARRDITADDIEKAIFAGVASRSNIRKWTDIA